MHTRASRTRSDGLAIAHEVNETCRVRDVLRFRGSIPSDVMLEPNLPDDLERRVGDGRIPNIVCCGVRNSHQCRESCEERAERARSEHTVV